MASENKPAIINEDEDIQDQDEGDTEQLLKKSDDDEDSNVDVQIDSAPEKPLFKVARIVLGIGTFFMLFGFLATAIILIAVSPPCNKQSDLVWWKRTIIYQCYPLSFQDTDGNGYGDLKGIEQRAQHFSDIGVDTVWLNPIFKSPQKDNGYDISNYTEIDPLFGTMADFQSLLSELHKKGIHLLMDFVPNHTSDEHPWFVASRSNRSDPKRDWYIWADASESGGPPSNWISVFGGSAWTLDEATSQYYLHQFSEFQPDLNYSNPIVRAEMNNILKFWLDLGVDGFRMDAVPFLLENAKFTDEFRDSDFKGPNCTVNISSPDCYYSLNHTETFNYGPIHDVIKGWRDTLNLYSERFMVGEVYAPIEIAMEYYGTNNSEFDFPFNFFLLDNKNWTGVEVSNIVSEWLDNMPEGAWPNWVLGNHDNPRIASKVGLYLARALNVLLLTLPGTPTTYYGEEIFMTDVYVPPDERKDKYQGRDAERTPMQWNTTLNAGFSEVKPWLPLATNYTTYNVEVESNKEKSMLSLYKELSKLRASNNAFQYSNYTQLLNTTDLYAFHRYHKSSTDEFVVVVNFATEPTKANLTSIAGTFKDPVYELSTVDVAKGSSVDLSAVSLAGGEAIVIKGVGVSSKSCG